MANSQRRQMMQPWPLCLVPLSRTKERSVLPKYYTRVPSVARSSATSSAANLDCSSSTTIATNASPFNSQTALIAEKQAFAGTIAPPSTNQQHYYAQNLRNQQQALHGARMYDPLDKNLDPDYKQLDPLLAGEPPYSVNTKAAMSSQDVKVPKDAISMERLRKPSLQFPKEVKPSVMRFATQVIVQLFNWSFFISPY